MANPGVPLLPRGDAVVEFASAGRANDRRCCRAGGGVPCRSLHELETPEAEHCPGLKRLLKTTHLELNGKLFVNTQQAPTWRANCRRFDPGGSLDRRVNCRRVFQPRWVEREGEREGGRKRGGRRPA